MAVDRASRYTQAGHHTASNLLATVNEVTRILSAVEQGDAHAAEQLLPLVYVELRALAAQRLSQEKSGQTLQATALVHEAYLRLVGQARPQQWDNRRHFFAAAAEAMRRILVESARRKKSQKRGGEFERIELASDLLVSDPKADSLVAIDAALSKLAQQDAQAAELVKLRFFAGFSITQAAEILGISRSTAYEQWTYARAWLQCAIEGDV
jgi:RNA polymerase sigma factor (TIGR02999 family)